MFEIHIETNWPVAKLSPTAHLVPPNVLDGLKNPHLFGYEAGVEWVKTASPEAIHEAATRMTSNQQLVMYFDYYHKRVEEGEEGLDGNIFITWPSQENSGYDNDISEEISDFFKNLKLKYFYFNGHSDHEDKQVCSNDGSFYISEAPNFEFRAFEDGWTSAVREVYKSALLSAK